MKSNATAIKQDPSSAQEHVPRTDNIIAIASGKGGVGKTFLSISLSQAFSKLNKKTLLFDGDLGLANVDIQLGLMPERDLGSVLGGGINLKQSIIHFDLANFDIIAGRSGVGNFATLPPLRLAQLRNELFALGNSYDFVLVDLGAGVDRTMRLLSAYAGSYIVVTNAEPTALTDAYAFIKITLYEDPDAKIKIIINMADSHKEGERTFLTLSNACREFLKISPQLAGVVRRDKKVPDSIRYQTPILTRHPSCHAASDIMDIAYRLTNVARKNK